MSDPAELLEGRLKAVAEGADSPLGLHFFCQIGGTSHPNGMITLQLSASGWALLGWRQGAERTLFSVQLTEADQRRFYKMLLAFPFWRALPQKRPALQNEINIHIRISDMRLGTWSGLQFWDGDMKEFPVLREMMYRVCRLVRAISEEEIETPDWSSA